MRNVLNITVLIARLLIGGILIYASVDKIANPAEFAQAIYNYHIVSFGLENTMAVIIPWLELIIGLCLIFGILIDGASFLVIVLMVIFITAISYAIISGYNIECGCGLKPGELVGMKKIIEDFIYLILALIIIKRPNRYFELYL